MKIYLIREKNSEKYKIGYTSLSIKERIKQLQTGNAEQIEEVTYFKSSMPKTKIRLLETSIHAHFQSKRGKGEWFYLNNEDVNNFQKICENIQKKLITSSILK